MTKLKEVQKVKLFIAVFVFYKSIKNMQKNYAGGKFQGVLEPGHSKYSP